MTITGLSTTNSGKLILFLPLCLPSVGVSGHCRSGGGEKEACWGHGRRRWCHIYPGEREGALTTAGML